MNIDVDSSVNFLLVLASVVLALGVVHRAGLGMYRAARRIEGTFDLVNHELTANSGSSLYDAIRRIDASTSALEGRVVILEDRRTESRRADDPPIDHTEPTGTP